MSGAWKSKNRIYKIRFSVSQTLKYYIVNYCSCFFNLQTSTHLIVKNVFIACSLPKARTTLFSKRFTYFTVFWSACTTTRRPDRRPWRPFLPLHDHPPPWQTNSERLDHHNEIQTDLLIQFLQIGLKRALSFADTSQFGSRWPTQQMFQNHFIWKIYV